MIPETRKKGSNPVITVGGFEAFFYYVRGGKKSTKMVLIYSPVSWMGTVGADHRCAAHHKGWCVWIKSLHVVTVTEDSLI